MKIYRKFDAWIIAGLNDLYLWLLDWTGVYIGTITFLMGAEQVAFLIYIKAAWFAAFMLLMILVNAGIRYHQQAMGLVARYNLAAEWFEKSPIRTALIAFGVGLIMADIIQYRWWYLFDGAITQALLYLWCLKIRERQKKEFRLPKLAMQGTR